jgi:glycosyltransferase involved in cell wall biosynthesis
MYRNGVPLEAMASIYTATDVLLAASMGEGFGLPTMEAQACATRVIVSDFAASAELVGDGWRIDGQPQWDAPQKAWFHVPNVESIVNALEEAYQQGRIRSQKAQDFAAAYEADRVWAEHWRPILAKY